MYIYPVDVEYPDQYLMISICFLIFETSANELSAAMISLQNIIHFLFLAATSFTPVASSVVKWSACNTTEVTSPLPIQCANLNVPLDYTNLSSNATLSLQLARVPASIQPSKGSILLNFGGPGGTGRDSLGLLAGLLQL